MLAHMETRQDGHLPVIHMPAHSERMALESLELNVCGFISTETLCPLSSILTLLYTLSRSLAPVIS